MKYYRLVLDLTDCETHLDFITLRSNTRIDVLKLKKKEEEENKKKKEKKEKLSKFKCCCGKMVSKRTRGDHYKTELHSSWMRGNIDELWEFNGFNSGNEGVSFEMPITKERKFECVCGKTLNYKGREDHFSSKFHTKFMRLKDEDWVYDGKNSGIDLSKK